MFKKHLLNITAAVFTVCTLLGTSVSANATTVDDVAAVARSYGYSEDLINQGYNKYYENPDLYDSSDFDLAIERLHEAGRQLVTTGPQDPEAFTTTAPASEPVTTAPASEGSAPAGSERNSTQTVTTSIIVTTDVYGSTVTQIVTSPAVSPSGNGDSSGGEVVLTMPDGSTFTRMSTKDFIKLSYEQKMAYLRTFTPEQQQIFINNLTPEEYRSMLKQAPQETKINVVDELSKAAGAMGMNITIDEISDDSISVAMRNENGELIGVANSGASVADTGYDRSRVFLTAGLLFLAAAAGTVLIIRKCFRKELTEESNE